MIISLNDKLAESKYYKPHPKGDLIDRLTNIKWEYPDKKDYSKKNKIQSLFFIEDNLEGEYSHKNYMEYLLAAWDSHWGIIVSPDIIWYTLQCELTSIVSTHVETYRSLFSDSPDKQEILVFSPSLTVMPLDTLMQALVEKIPSDVKAFLPEFSTSTQRSIFARYAAFCDMVSPYYNYGMFCCGFPAIDVRGDLTDWQRLHTSWQELGKLFTSHQDYIARVDAVLEKICLSLNDADFWRDMFALDQCGSGHQYTVSGWLASLYEQEPDLKFPENYPSHISEVNYKQLNTKKNYVMKQGLLYSRKENGFLLPDFGHIVYEKTDKPVTTNEKNELVIESEVITAKDRKLDEKWTLK